MAHQLTAHQVRVLGMIARGKSHMVGNCRADRLAIEGMRGLVTGADSVFRGVGSPGYALTDAGRAALAEAA